MSSTVVNKVVSIDKVFSKVINTAKALPPFCSQSVKTQSGDRYYTVILTGKV